MNSPPYRLADADWLTLLERSYLDSSLGLPGFPPEDVQSQWIGTPGIDSLRQAFSFYLKIKTVATLGEGPILDFGVGYGRISRVFLNDVAADQIYGVDTNAAILKRCREAGVPGQFLLIEPEGSLRFPDKMFSVVYAFSVFSHLPEAVQDRWLAEIARVAKSGATFVATVNSRSVLDHFRSLAAHTRTWRLSLRQPAPVSRAPVRPEGAWPSDF